MDPKTHFYNIINNYHNAPLDKSTDHLEDIEDYLIYDISPNTQGRLIIDFFYEEILHKEHLSSSKEIILVKTLLFLFFISENDVDLLEIVLVEDCKFLINLIRKNFMNDISLIGLIENGRVECLKFMYHERVPWNKDIDYLFSLSPEMKGRYPRMVPFFRENLENWRNGIFLSNIKPCKK